MLSVTPAQWLSGAGGLGRQGGSACPSKKTAIQGLHRGHLVNWLVVQLLCFQGFAFQALQVTETGTYFACLLVSMNRMIFETLWIQQVYFTTDNLCDTDLFCSLNSCSAVFYWAKSYQFLASVLELWSPLFSKTCRKCDEKLILCLAFSSILYFIKDSF